MDAPPLMTWEEHGQQRSAVWRADGAAPRRVALADDTLAADAAYRLACEGTALLWRGDFQNARQLLQALMRRLDKPARRKAKTPPKPLPGGPVEVFHAHRQAQAQRARVLYSLLIQVGNDYGIGLRRAPDVRQACNEAWGRSDGQAGVVPLRALQGLIGAHEWRKKGVDVAALTTDQVGAFSTDQIVAMTRAEDRLYIMGAEAGGVPEA